MDRLRAGLMVGAALGLAACNGEQPNAPPAPAAAATASVQQNADTLAWLFALAMEDASVRASVRDALRASPFVEHKVALQDLLATAAGRALIAGAAGQSARSEADIIALAAPLHDFDLYMPGATYRRAWRGGAEVAVAAVTALDRSVITGYFPNGSKAAIYNGPGYELKMRPATLYLEPSEGRSLRPDSRSGLLRASAAIADAPVEDAGESSWGGSYVLWDKGALVAEVPLSIASGSGSGPQRLDAVCDPTTAVNGCPDDGSSAPPPPPPPPQVYLSRVNINHVCDNGDCSQNNEFEWHTYAWNGSGWVSRRDIKLSLPSTIDQSYGNTLVANSYPPGVSSMKLQSDIVETDPNYMSPDDKFLPSPQWFPGESGVRKGAGDPRCYMNEVDAMTNNCRWYNAQEVMTTMLW